MTDTAVLGGAVRAHQQLTDPDTDPDPSLSLSLSLSPSPDPLLANNGSNSTSTSIGGVPEGLEWGSGPGSGGEGEGGWTLGDTPWIPALVVGCGMVVFLSLSFFSHHKRVRRKRELLMDYLSALLYSGAWTRGRSVSILCNTNSIALSELGRSFKIKFKDEDMDSSSHSADRLRDKYLKDLLAFSSSAYKKRKKGLKRFISAPSEHKFRRVAGHLINRNKGRLARGGLGALARNLSMPDGPFDSCDFDVPSSLAEARTSITQGVLLDPNRMPHDDGCTDGPVRLQRSATACEPFYDDGTDSPVRLQRSATACEPCYDDTDSPVRFQRSAAFAREPRFTRSYESVAYSDRTNHPEQLAVLKGAHPHFSVTVDGYPVDGQVPSEFCLARDQSHHNHPSARSMDATTSAVFQSTQHEDAESSASECFGRDMHSETPLSASDVSVSVTRCSAFPQYSHAFKPTRTLQYSPRVVEIPDDCVLSFDSPFQEECNINRRYQNESSDMVPRMNSHTSVVYASGKEHSRSRYESSGFTGRTRQADVDVQRNPQSCSACRVNTYPTSFPFVREHSLCRFQHASKDHGKEYHTQEYALMPLELHAQSLDERERNHNSSNPDLQEKRAVTFTKSLDDGAKKSARRYPMQDRVNGTEYNPLFPGETHSFLSVQNPAAFLPAAFSCQLPPLAREAREACPSDSLVPSRAPNLATAKALNCRPTSNTSKDFRKFKPKSRGALSKTLSTQSTMALISGSGTPPQGFGSLDSDPLSSTPPAQRFVRLHEEPEAFPFSNSNNNNNEPKSFADQMFPGDAEPDDGARSWLVSDYPHRYPSQGGFSLRTVGGASLEDPSASRRAARGVHRWDTDTTLPLRDVHQWDTETMLPLERLFSPGEARPEVRQTSNVHRLPRFQVRSGMNQHRKLLAQQYCHVKGECM